MESVLGRYRNLIVLAIVLSAQLLGLAVQVKRNTGSDSSRLIRIWAVEAVNPFEKSILWIQNSTSGVWHNYLYLRGVRAENRELKQEIEQMRLAQVRMTQDADQARRLQALLSFKEQFISKTMAAQVIGSSGSELSRSIYIDKGENSGVRPDMAVINAEGIVGKVLRVYPSSSLVLLVDDQSSGVGAILEKSRLQGILRGTPSGEVVLEKVMSDENVAPGERVLTSGGDRIFPKGLTIGVVKKVSPGNDLFWNIQIKPSADLTKLEEVLVVTKVDEKQATPDTTGPVRAADILAERLPTVPPKPTDAAGPMPAQVGTKPNPSGTPPTAKPSQPGASTAAASTGTAAAARTSATGAKPGPTTTATSKPAAAPSGAPSGVTKSADGTPKSAAVANSSETRRRAVAPAGATSTPANISQGGVKPDAPAKPDTPPQDNPQ